jgi:YHS domain-containing protein
MSDRADSLFSQFATAHLLTDAERAVFEVLADSLQRVWTAGGVAREAGVSDHEADRALRRFNVAGIVERLDDSCRPRRYRWRPEMGYLHHTSEPSGRRDPVCGMPVPADSPHIVVHDGQEVVFCSLRCLVRWRSEHRARHEATRPGDAVGDPGARAPGRGDRRWRRSP